MSWSGLGMLLVSIWLWETSGTSMARPSFLLRMADTKYKVKTKMMAWENRRWRGEESGNPPGGEHLGRVREEKGGLRLLLSRQARGRCAAQLSRQETQPPASVPRCTGVRTCV